jgi:uncharacterized membrane protein
MSWKPLIAVFVGTLVAMLVAAPLMDWSRTSHAVLLIPPVGVTGVVAVMLYLRNRRARRPDGRRP